MRKHDQILNNDQMSNPSSVISIYTIILQWKISVMLMIFVIWDTYSSDVHIISCYYHVNMSCLYWNGSFMKWIDYSGRLMSCLCYCGSHNKFVCVYSRMKGISVCCLTNNCEQLLIGTEIGNIYILDLNSFKLLDQIIYQDVVMQKSV